MRIIKLSDRFKLKIHDVELTLAPLSLPQKSDIMSAVSVKGGTYIQNQFEMVKKSLKYSVKGISGVQDLEGNTYELSFDENGDLTDECVSELLSAEMTTELILASAQMLEGRYGKVTDPNTNEPIKGVEFILGKPKKRKKKAL